MAKALTDLADGHDVRVFEKDYAESNCYGACTVNDKTKSCKTYSRAHARQISDLAQWHPDIAIECHINRGHVGAHGALVITNDTDMAESWGASWLQQWTDLSPIGTRGQGLYRMPRDRHAIYGAERRLPALVRQHTMPVVIVEAGFASSATDSAYLSTSRSYKLAAELVALTTTEVAIVD